MFAKVRFPRNREILLPFIVREKKLISFADLTLHEGPFHDVVSEHGAAERHEVSDWVKEEKLTQWLVTLLNRTISKYAGWLGLSMTRTITGSYFPPEIDDNGNPRRAKSCIAR